MANKRYIRSRQFLERALHTIPLGSQTFSKSITQYPKDVSPHFVVRGEGGRIWDVDGNEYIDFVNALASVVIGYNDKTINSEVQKQLQNGISFSLPHPLEIDVAEMLVEMIPCAEMVRFGKNGTDATSASIRLARAYTGRERIIVCGYHGWQDWYIGSTSRDLGVPEVVKSLTHCFQYNDLASLRRLFQKFPDQIAAVIMEPMNVAWPKDGFLAAVKDLTQQNSAILIFDETITGCRFARGGAQELFGVTPDLATFGKGLANGFPLSAVLGRREIMKKMEDIFYSSTFAGETLSLAAAKATLTMIRDGNVIEELEKKGKRLSAGLSNIINKYNAHDVFSVAGHPSWTFLQITDAPPYSSFEIRTLFLQEIFKRGILSIGSHNLSYAHTEADINQLLTVYDTVLPLIIAAIQNKDLLEKLDAKPLEPLFKVR